VRLKEDGRPSAPTGQFAERQGRQAALNLVRILNGEAAQPFRFNALGQLCSIGGYQAVAEMLGLHSLDAQVCSHLVLPIPRKW
jgi:NADH dehydrogenase